MQLVVWCQKYQQENIETNKIINMKLFTKADNAKLFANYSKGSDMANQNVVVKIFNPYGNGRWYIMNSDPNDPNYLWGIVDLGQGAEIGSISRSDLENYRNRFGWGFERDMSFRPRNAKEVLKGLNEGEYFDGGGNVEKPLTRFRVGESFKYKNNGTIIYKVIKTYNDGGCEAKDDEGDTFTFEEDELNQFVKAENTFDGGGEVEFIEYGDSEIMYEPHYKKYYANEMEFDNLEDAKKFIDSGEVPYFIKDAYAKGLFKKGGRLLSTRERYIDELKGLSGLQQKAIEDYIDENNLTSDEILHIVIGLGRKQISRTDVSTAIVGTKNNAESKKLLAFAKSKESLKAEYGAFMDGVYAGGGKIIGDESLRKAEFFDNVKYKNRIWEVTQERGKVGLISPGYAFEESFDFIPITKINVEEVTDMQGNKLKFPIDANDFDNFRYSANGGLMDGVYAGGGGLKKYILRGDIKEVWVKRDNGIQFTFKGSDVLNGANFLAKGNLLTNDAIYVPKRNIMYVILKNGNKVKPTNGYWIKKDAKGELFKPEKNDEYKVESNVGIFYKVGTKTYWYVVNSKGQTINKNTGKPYKGKEMTNYYFLNEDGAKDFAEKLNKGLFVERKFEHGGDFPDVGETIKGSDIDYDMKDYFNRTNKKLIITTKDNKIHTGGSVTKFYNDLIFVAKDKFDIPVKDILKVKILK